MPPKNSPKTHITKPRAHRSKLHAFVHRHAKRGFWVAVDHLFPHAGNDYRPHLIRHRTLFGYSIILILLKVIVILGPVALPSSSLYSSAITAKNIIALTNQARRNLDLPDLKSNEQLAEAAARKANDMLENGYFAHTSPKGRTPWDWIKDVGYRYRRAGENLAVHFQEAEDVQGGWMASPTHRANIVNPVYSEIGIGTAMGEFEGVKATFVVQMFGTPAVEAAEPVSAPVEKPSIINEKRLSVIDRKNKVDVRVAAAEAEVVSASLAYVSTDLIREGTADEWKGSIQYEPGTLPATGEPLLITAAKAGFPPETKAVALIAPDASIQKFFIFNEGSDKYSSFFSGLVKVGNLNDKVREFYLGFVVFLSAGVLMYMFTSRLKIRHPSMLSHSLAVVVLAVFLLVV
ncbi:MAG: CAP domain-containing protein [Patescibacteria group bacterium]